MKNNRLRFPIDYVVADIQKDVTKKYKSELNFFNKKLKDLAGGEIALTDKLTILPHLLLQEGIYKSILACLNGTRSHFFLSDIEIPQAK